MKKFQSIGVLLSAITGMLVVLLVSVFAYSAKQAYDRREAAAQLLKTVDVLSEDFAAEELLRLQEGAIDTALSQPHAIERKQRFRLHQHIRDLLNQLHCQPTNFGKFIQI